MLVIEEILLRRKNKIIVVAVNGAEDCFDTKKDRIVATIMKNAEALGFTFSQELFEALRKEKEEDLKKFGIDLLNSLKKLKGADVEYSPMYPNFPKQVADASVVELFVNAIIHYWSFGEILPEYEKDERMPLFDNVDLTPLTVGSFDDVYEISANIVKSGTSISETDKADVKTILLKYENAEKYLPEEITQKEIIAYISALLIEFKPEYAFDYIAHYYKTATDVLRLATSLSDGDISLATNTRYKHFSRPERRLIMKLLANCKNPIEDMFRYREKWLRLGEIIHPNEFKEYEYTNVHKCFKMLRENDKPLFLMGKVELALAEGKCEEALGYLSQRPGEFARKLDKLLREADNVNYVINTFRKLSDRLSVPVLLQVRQHFLHRDRAEDYRVVFPKGNFGKVRAIGGLPHIDEKVSEIIVKSCDDALIDKFTYKEPMGNVYIDESFKKIIAPFSSRSASNTVKAYTRGSRIPIPENAKFIRPFVWWTNLPKEYNSSDDWFDCEMDVDLSAIVFNENWENVGDVYYGTLREEKFGLYHSGDITNGGGFNGKGVTEFIDADIEKVVSAGGRYLLFNVISYSGQPFFDVEHIKFGWMTREDADCGEIFEASTVQEQYKLNAPSSCVLPVIFDCVEREMIWCDVVSTKIRGCCCNVANTGEKMRTMCHSLVNADKISLYDLIRLNVEARGVLVNSREKADVIFSNDTTVPQVEQTNEDGETVLIDKENITFITSFDSDVIMSDLF